MRITHQPLSTTGHCTKQFRGIRPPHRRASDRGQSERECRPVELGHLDSLFSQIGLKRATQLMTNQDNRDGAEHRYSSQAGHTGGEHESEADLAGRHYVTNHGPANVFLLNMWAM
jgi:hypothetical protein